MHAFTLKTTANKNRLTLIRSYHALLRFIIHYEKRVGENAKIFC